MSELGKALALYLAKVLGAGAMNFYHRVPGKRKEVET